MKRVFDFNIALLSLIILSPIMVCLAIAIRLILGAPVFFTQIRPGLHGKPFKIIKFRTMRLAYDESGNLLEDELRLTFFGQFLRSTSLDELPELWNVLKGEMSLVGPRPLLLEYLPLYNSEQLKRHEVRPGITGWAQINGRNSITWEEKFELDLWYIKNQSFLLDFKIILQTIKAVVSRHGVTAEDDATMPKFKGTM